MVALATCIIGLALSIEGFLFINNTYVEGWFPAVYLTLMIPFYLGAFLLLVYINEDTQSGRYKLKLGVILTIASVVALYSWKLFYYTCLYGHKEVVIGSGEEENQAYYLSFSKKSYIMEQTLLCFFIVMLQVYFWFTCDTWVRIAKK